MPCDNAVKGEAILQAQCAPGCLDHAIVAVENGLDV
jgi:hypothetical protein